MYSTSRLYLCIAVQLLVFIVGVAQTQPASTPHVTLAWGDTVNIASRMESMGQLGAIQVSETTYEHLKEKYFFEKRGKIEVKGKGKMTTYLLTGRKAVLTPSTSPL